MWRSSEKYPPLTFLGTALQFFKEKDLWEWKKPSHHTNPSIEKKENVLDNAPEMVERPNEEGKET